MDRVALEVRNDGSGSVTPKKEIGPPFKRVVVWKEALLQRKVVEKGMGAKWRLGS